MDEKKRIVEPIKDIPLVLLKKGEVFTLKDKYYSSSDESLIIRSTRTTGYIFKPVEPDAKSNV